MKALVERLEELLLINADSKSRIRSLTDLLANVHDELHDPMGQYWGDNPYADRVLLESLRDRIDRAMGWVDEEGK
jgi:hypothetical protein